MRNHITILLFIFFASVLFTVNSTAQTSTTIFTDDFNVHLPTGIIQQDKDHGPFPEVSLLDITILLVEALHVPRLI